jgi:hypothetical protein
VRTEHISNLTDFLPSFSPWETAGGASELALVHFFRGCIISSFGMVETQLNEIAVRCSRIEAYHRLSLKFPWKTDDRLQFLKKAFQEEGVLSDFKSTGFQTVVQFEKMRSDRNLWAHGLIKVFPGSGVHRWTGARIHIEHFNPGNGCFQYEMRVMNSADVQKLCLDVKNLADDCNHLHCNLSALLPRVDI